ncbi:mitochondrial carrier domain-containing protein [Mycena leptocephala]|nr:mitochondrial carrier domain-containing protein [Mycena leptocephala]
MSSAPQKKQPYPFWLGGSSAHPCNLRGCSAHQPQGLLNLTKVQLQASGDKRMIESIKKMYRTAGVRGLFDGISRTWLCQMSCSMCCFWVYDESRKFLGMGKDTPVWKLALVGSMVGGIAGFVGNPGGIACVLSCLQGDLEKPPEKWFNYKNCFDALFHMIREEGPSSLACSIGPNIFRVILMNASQLASFYRRRDFFKAELLKTRYFDDNIMCHFTVSFAAVRFSLPLLSSCIMNASSPSSNSTLGIIYMSFQTEGAMFMFKGRVPTWTRLQLTTILIFLMLEQLKNGVDWTRGRGIEVL